jgi:serine/threonine protein kinase/CheY-like chemotaxis protein
MKKKILLVEYATSTIETLKEILAYPFFDITVANEGDTAKQFLAEQRFDLMITAAMLPKFHGFSLSQHAARQYPGIKIIITSQIYKGVEYRHQAISEYRADDFFEIPLDEKKLKARVFELLGIDEKYLEKNIGMAAAQAPISDTAKVPTLKKIAEGQKNLTSEDLFGDIIEKVQEIPSYEIKLDEEQPPAQPPESTATQEFDAPKTRPLDQYDKPAVTAELTRPDALQQLGKKLSQPASANTQRIDLSLLDLLHAGKKDRGRENVNEPPREKDNEAKKKQRARKIEDDISRKWQDTLSGLGIDPGKTPLDQPDSNTAAGGFGDFELIELIGRGGMAEIYKAKKKGVKGFEKIIALKKILTGYGEDVKYIEMLVDEAKIAAELTHPNIVQIYDLGQKDDCYFIAMEYVPGKDLRFILQKMAKKRVNLPEELGIYLVTKVLEALNYAHSARDSGGKRLDIVHRDISPPNILVSYNGNIKLTDFGVSKASIKMHQTLAGALKGKILYMSPEQASGEENIDYRSDLYSAGIILFELITGKKLFLGSSEILTLKKVQEGIITRPSQIKPGIAPELEAIILKALEKDINKRYQKASEMIRDLDAYMRKHYHSLPESGHFAHFIVTLLKEEIKKENIEINISSPPQPVRKTKQLETQDTLILKPEAQPPTIPGEEFPPVVNIRFDGKKKRNILLGLLIIVIILAVVIAYLLTKKDSTPSTGGQQPGTSTPIAAGDPGKPPANKQDTPPPAMEKKETQPPVKTPAQVHKKNGNTKKTKEKKKKETTKTQTPAKKPPEVAENIPRGPDSEISRQTRDKSPAALPRPAPRIPPEPVVREGDIVSANNVDTQAIPIAEYPVTVPYAIRRLLINDERILVTWLVDHNGSVEIVKIIQESSMKRLNTYIEKIIKKRKYKPASKNNVNVKVWKNEWIIIRK